MAFLVAAGVVVAPAPASAAVTGTVKLRSGVLNVRAGATTASARVGTLRNGAKVSISCQVTGQYIRGDVRSTSLWNRLSNGRYISHAYVQASGSIPKCGSSSKASSASGWTVKVNGGGVLNVRAQPTTASALVGTLRNGTKVSIECQVTGQYVRGDVRSTSLWNRLSNGRYISHAYVAGNGTLKTCAATTPKASPSPTASASPVNQMTNEEFIAAAVPGAQQGWREFEVPASVTIAQAILESGWGRSALSTNDRNYFGIKCFNNDPGPIAIGCRTYRTTECDKQGKCTTTSASFRTYRSMADSFRDHGHFLRSNSRYASAFTYSRDPDKFLVAIWKAGYATDPEYDTKVINIMKKYNLYAYDIWR
ncbi:MAG TPA: sporangiospore maturation cell wall hydrolase GsmA [Micromonospora sp.]